MATNSGRGNPIAAEGGPSKTTDSPPPVGSETKMAVGTALSNEAMGIHESGQDANAVPVTPRVLTRQQQMDEERKGTGNQGVR